MARSEQARYALDMKQAAGSIGVRFFICLGDFPEDLYLFGVRKV